MLKPEYILRPVQIFRRLSFQASRDLVNLKLPWNCRIWARSSEVIGRSIATQGVYDLPLTEAIARLADPGDVAIDVGANIGYMSLVLARAVGPTGHLRCFEPNPSVFRTLQANTRSWTTLHRIASIEVEAMALSDRTGQAILGFPEEYATNEGVACLETDSKGVSVRVFRLDDLETNRVGIMKVDVEGHEASVFAGAETLLSRQLVRDILFEERLDYPARSHEILIRHGYRIFRLARTAWRPILSSPEDPVRVATLLPNYLATLDSARAQSRFASLGWKSLSNRPS